MNLKIAKDNNIVDLDGEHHIPLFKNDEIERAESIVRALDGMTIDSANELLTKVSESLTQIMVIQTESKFVPMTAEGLIKSGNPCGNPGI